MRVKENVREYLHTFKWTPILGVVVPMDSWILKYRMGQTHWVQKFFISLKNSWNINVFKMGSHDSFGWLKHKLWPKEGSGVKLPIWLPTIKSQESPWLPCVQVACHISLERSPQRLQFCFKLHFDRRFSHKVMGPQSCKSPNFGNMGLPFGSSGTKWHLGVGFVAMHII
jgi:hypothetical protein